MEINGNQWKSMERNENQDSAEECWGQNLTEKHRLGPYFTFWGPGNWFGTCFGTFRKNIFSTFDQNFNQNSRKARKINGNQWKSMEINGNQWKSMEINRNQQKSIEINGN